MSTKKPRIYWDSSVWIAWDKDDHGARVLCSMILGQAEATKLEIAVSPMMLAEFASQRPEVDALLDSYLKRSGFVMVQFSKFIAEHARTLVRQNRGLPGVDAVHLASALHARADELHTYDKHLLNLAGGVPGIKICRPEWLSPLQMTLDAVAASEDHQG